MISFKSFVTALHGAIVEASTSLMGKNVELLDRYFTEVDRVGKDAAGKEVTKKHLVPRNVVLEYPTVDSDGNTVTSEVAVPLITLVPLAMTRIDSVTLTANFVLDVVKDEVQMDFKNRRSMKNVLRSKQTPGTLEITIKPQDTPEGLRVVVEAYEAILRRQIS